MNENLVVHVEGRPTRHRGPSFRLVVLGAAALACAALFASTSAAVVHNVTTPIEFAAAASVAVAGDEIVVADGVHPDWGLLQILVSGDPAAPIVIRSATPGGATLDGDVNLRIHGDWIQVEGLRFTGTPQPYPLNYTIWIGQAENVRITDSEFIDRGNISNGGRWLGNILLQHSTHHILIDNNTFDGYVTNAFYMYVQPTAFPDFPTHISISDNFFLNGKIEEAIAIGSGNNGNDGNQSTFVTIEGNLFENHVSQNGNGTEMIQIKTSDNVIRGNTFRDCFGHISNRSGKRNVYDGNVIVNQFLGIRVIDADNEIVNNLFIDNEDAVALSYGNVNYPATTGTLITQNTFVNSSDNALTTINQGLSGATAPNSTAISNNVFIGAGGAMIDDDMGTALSIERNLFHPVDGQPIAGHLGEAAIFADPAFAPADETGVFSTTGPAIDTGYAPASAAAQASADGEVRPQGCGSDLGHLELSAPNCSSGVAEVVLTSIPAEDGWIRESSEGSGVGGAVKPGGAGSGALRAGDDNKDRQRLAIVSFDTSAIPAGATVFAARLELTRGTDKGTNPFVTHGSLLVDVKSGHFGGSPALEKEDFEAAATEYSVAEIVEEGPNGSLYSIDLSADGAAVSGGSSGRTQLRFAFQISDDDDLAQDHAGFYSAENSNVSRRPRLVVLYRE